MAYVPYVIVGSLSLLTGIALGHVLGSHQERRAAAGFALLGLAAGLILGLSSSPLIASVTTAAFGLVGTALGLYFNQKSGTPIGFRLGDWLAPFAALLIVGSLTGIAIRVNEWLYFPDPPPSPSLRKRLSDLGFSTDQIDQIMAEQAKAFGNKNLVEPPKPESPPSPVGFLSEKERATLRMLFDQTEDIRGDAEKVNFIEKNSPELKERIARLRSRTVDGKEPSPSWIIEALRREIQP